MQNARKQYTLLTILLSLIKMSMLNNDVDDVYDIVHDRFERTQPKTFDIEDYMKEFRIRVNRYRKSEFKRDLVDYKELVELDDDDIVNLQ